MNCGYLGGTFDPPHLGHLNLAQEAIEKFSLNRVLFVPSRIPPHKKTGTLSEWEHRLEMTRLATESNPLFSVADLEPAESASYTVDLLAKLASDGELPSFIMGMDSLEEFHSWREPRRILELARVLVGTRPGYRHTSVSPELLHRVHLFQFPGVLISSSEIRERIVTGRSISYLVPECVESYIRSRGLYGAEKSNRQHP